MYECGFASFVRQWGEQALDEVEEEAQPFVRKRLEEILTMAQSFDQNGGRNIDLFIDFARRTEASKGAMESSIRAMTIHGSKGLTFDMVIMPDLGRWELKIIQVATAQETALNYTNPWRSRVLVLTGYWRSPRNSFRKRILFYLVC